MVELRKLIETSTIASNTLNETFQQVISQKNTSKLRSLSKYKNFCLFSGRGRTYSRDLFIARHNLRKLVSVGLMPGLIK
jgi:ribosomal protein S14